MTSYSATEIWLLMVISGIATFLIRYSFIAAEGHYSPPDWFRALMPFVPIAMLAALTVPDVLVVNGMLVAGLANAKAGAALLAIVVAARWRNIILTILSGFIALFLLRALA